MIVDLKESKYSKDKGVKQFKLSEMITKECFERIYNDEVASNELIAVVGCMMDKVEIKEFNITLHKY